MRKYTFEFKDNGRDEYGAEDFKDHTKFVDYVYLNADESDCEEFAREARQFLLARGYSPFTVNGLVYINWQWSGEPEYNDDFLVSLKGHEYASVAHWEDNEWYDSNGNVIDPNTIDTWAELPIGVHR